MNFEASPEYSLTTSLKKNIQQMPGWEDSSPGPMYNTRTELNSNTFSIGKSGRTPINFGAAQTPSPQHYQQQSAATKHSMSIPKASNKVDINTVPAPSWYKPTNQLTTYKTPNYSLGTKYSGFMDSPSSNPAPTDYKPTQSLQLLTKSKSVSSTNFSTARRFKYGQASTPGIGKYNVDSENLLSKKTTIPKAEVKAPKEIPPGPSDYPIKSTFQHSIQKQPGKSLSMRFKSAFQNTSNTDFAFGKYFQNPQKIMATHRSSQKYSIGKQERILFRDNNQPGPTDYINDNSQPKQKHNAIIPQGKRTQYNGTLDNPGPGSYQLKSKEGPQYTIGKSKSVTNLADNPGAGRYNLSTNTLRQEKGSAFGKGKRASFASTNTAGVGDYTVSPDTKRASLSFAKADRFGKQESAQPGPGDYHVHSIIGYKHKQQSK